ncbi:MAG: NAD(P)/FAD-dependent oxidoreductase [Desulfamplus sp.]|nr:NAD(P)/FAD-dependent oxidoreductase [Desulfamplus sp.]
MQKTAVIIGAGPAGLTAAYELVKRGNIKPIVLEKSPDMGGLSKTISYKGNRIDIGGHRFFSKNERVNKWWLEILPLENPAQGSRIRQSNLFKMIKKNRISRIYYQKHFFDYPVTLSSGTLLNLGLLKTAMIGVSYLSSLLDPKDGAENLEDFFISRFGRELYKTFFRSYTEKVWGIPCSQISARWGSQRIKGLSILSAFKNIFQQQLGIGKQKKVETSLINEFMYPALGPGQMWDETARHIEAMGGQILRCKKVTCIDVSGTTIRSVAARDLESGEIHIFSGDYFFSTMPVRDLVSAMEETANPSFEIRRVASGLQYRDFITVGILVDRLKIRDSSSANGLIRDNWIYIQEPDVLMGRIQIFNNWSSAMVSDLNRVWLGLEYFCQEGDKLWEMEDSMLIRFAEKELISMGFIDADHLLDGIVVRAEKAYPAYFGTWSEFSSVRTFLNQFDNLYAIGRNGMHQYNNMDHSMLSAMTAVDNIVAGIKDRSNIWQVNTEEEYIETRPDSYKV